MIFNPEARPPLTSAERVPEPTAPTSNALRVRDLKGGEISDQSRPRLTSETAELFRGMYTRAKVRNTAVLAVCSAIAGEGKTTVSLGLAFTFAQDFPDRRVLVVEADVDRPILATRFSLDPSPGLVDCLQDEKPIQTAYRSTGLENLHLLPAGRVNESSGRVLRSSRMASAIDAMCQTHDMVILDVPAILANSDALPLIELAEGVIFVVRAGATPMPRVRRAIAQVGQERLRGVVLNGVTSAAPGWLRRLCGQ